MNKHTEDKTNEYFYHLFKTAKARELAAEINDYLYNESAYKCEVEDYHDRYKDGKRTDCIGYISKKGSYKFATMTMARKVCFVLHLGKRLHTERAIEMQQEIDTLLNRSYKKTDNTTLTPGEVYIRLEWVEDLDQIKAYIDEAYKLRLQSSPPRNLIKEKIDTIIKSIWFNDIPNDYKKSFLLYEDSLKCSLYYHLRKQLEEADLFQKGYRIYTEYCLSSNHRADIAIVKIDTPLTNDFHLKDCVTSIEVLIEIKYINGSNTKGFLDDIRKLVGYTKTHTNINLYTAFIHEPNITNRAWQKTSLHIPDNVRSRITELWGQRNEKHTLETRVTPS